MSHNNNQGIELQNLTKIKYNKIKQKLNNSSNNLTTNEKKFLIKYKNKINSYKLNEETTKKNITSITPHGNNKLSLNPTKNITNIRPPDNSSKSSVINPHKKVGSTFNFSNFKLNKIKNNIKVGVNVGSKSSVIVNIKDIIGKIRKPFDTNYISYFKLIINTNSQIRELKKQNYLNMNMFYIDNFKNYPGKYLAYIYYNYKDFYFIYDYDKKETKLYDIGDLEPSDIVGLFNDKIQNLTAINNNN